MIVRGLDSNHDWLFGKGKNDYFKNQKALMQSIDTRLLSFLGDCFFATSEGIDWWNLLGGKSKTALTTAISATISNTDGVTKVVEVSANIDQNRNILVSYQVTSVYSDSTLEGQVSVGA